MNKRRKKKLNQKNKSWFTPSKTKQKNRHKTIKNSLKIFCSRVCYTYKVVFTQLYLIITCNTFNYTYVYLQIYNVDIINEY